MGSTITGLPCSRQRFCQRQRTGGRPGNNSDIIRGFARGASDSLNQTGQKVVQRNLNIQPTLTIQPGFPVRVIVKP